MSTQILFSTSSASTVNAAALPADFTEYLAQRRGVSKKDAVDMLGDWILNYEPESEALRARRSLAGAAGAAA